ncbi:uncharacterized protein ALTATR162_LOCUS3091 [Alternaria atra]|uniref:Extracellular membrane protein CFEM domain-containing protein n=1 Tax=Alternaria atra TaxID=119953 RepID=A0A8J2MZR2_9PLEO|nr:uncharacterized protein ALTATR162_LOCUS3091 [Alternaria atra]CAG5153234.1 unnamed protein product [Alternaria atra]
MMPIVAIAGSVLAATATAALDPLITPRAELAPRQTPSGNDPALVGWVDATNEQWSDLRSCDYPATYSTSGSFAQCCASGSSDCIFWSSCSAATLFAAQTSLFCDQGYCNTAVVVPTVGASEGVSYLGCWATSLVQEAFTLVRDIGNADVASRSSDVSGDGSTASGSPASTAASESASETSSSATEASGSATPTTGAAAIETVGPLAGVVGLLTMLFGII